jgi:DNA-binding transcriptional ArsR family regulator
MTVPGPDRGLAFDALADSTRRAILRVLADRGEVRVGEIATEVSQVGRTAISSHLRILRSAGLVTERRDGRYRLYSIDGDSVRDVVEFLGSLYRAPLQDLKGRAGPDPEPRGGESSRRPGTDQRGARPRRKR